MKLASAGFVLLLALSGGNLVFADRGMVDPTRPLGYVALEQDEIETDLVLSAVMVTSKGQTAVINGQRVTEHERVEGAEVISIEPGRVVVRVAGQQQELKVHAGGVRMTPGGK